MGRALWLADRLRAHGLRVETHQGWETRGSASFEPQGVVVHHTAGGGGDIPSLNVVLNGREGLPGPLCHVLLARSGVCHVIASGRANHAGSGGYQRLSGNTSVLGIEAENDGVGEAWPAAQLDAFHRATAALLNGIGRDESWVCGHKEWTTRKIDPAGIDMDDFRAQVGAALRGDDVMTEEQMQTLGVWMKDQRTLTVGQVAEAVKEAEWRTRRILADLLDAVPDLDRSKLSPDTEAYLNELSRQG